MSAVFNAPFASAETPAERNHPATIAHGVAAVIEGHTIWTSEVEKSALHRYGQEILDGLGDNHLIAPQSERLHVGVAETEVDHQVASAGGRSQA